MNKLTRFAFPLDTIGVSLTTANALGNNESFWSSKGAAGLFTFVPRYGDEDIMVVQKTYGELLLSNTATDMAVSWGMIERQPNSRNINFVTALLLPYSTAQKAHIYVRGAGFTSSITDWYRLNIDISATTLTASVKIEKKIASGAVTDITPSVTTMSIDLTKCYCIRVLVYDVYIKVKIWEYGTSDEGAFVFNFIDTSLAGGLGSWAAIGGSHASISTSIISYNFAGASTQQDNLLTYGETLSNAIWLKTGTPTVVTAASVIVPDGSLGGSLISTAAASDSVYQAIASVPGTSFQAASVYFLKGGTATSVSFVLYWLSGGVTQYVVMYFNPSTGALAGNGAVGATLISATIEESKYGWYRVKLVGKGTDAANTASRFQLYTNDAAARSYHVWGARVDLGATVNPYYPEIAFPVTNRQFLEFLDDDTQEKVTLVEMSATGSSGVTPDFTKTVNYFSSDKGFRSTEFDVPVQREYIERINRIPTFSRSLGLALTGKGTTSSGSIVFDNPVQVSGQGGIYDDWLRRKWKKDFRMLHGGLRWRLFDMRPVLVGRLGQPTSDQEGEISFPTYDMSERFGDIFQSNLYSTAGAYQNKQKPYLIGVADFIECVPYDSANPLLYQYHDGSVSSNLPASAYVYDSAVSLVTPNLTVNAVAANVITTSANHGLLINHRLIWPSGSTPPTGISTSTEYWVISTPAANTLTLSIARGGAVQALTNGTGIGSVFNGFGYDNNRTTGILTMLSLPIGRVVIRPTVNQSVPLLIKLFGEIYSEVVFTKYALSANYKDTATFTALDAVSYGGYNLGSGIFFDSNQRSVGDCCDLVSKLSFTWYNWSNDGLMQVGMLGLPSPTPKMTFSIDDIELDSLRKVGGILPVDFSKALVTYLPRNFSGGAFQTGDTAFRTLKDYLPKLTAPAASTPIDNATQGDSKNPPTYDSLISDSTRAASFQGYLANFFSKQLGIFEFKTKLSASRLSIGQTIRLVHELEGWKVWSAENPASPDNTGYYDSTLAVVIGIDTDLSADSRFKTKLTVFRQVPMEAPATGEQVPTPLLDVDLSTSLIPIVGAQVAAPTFTRASIALVRDFEGIYKYAKSNEAVFYGARRVENLAVTDTDFYNWTNNGLLSKSYDTNRSPYYPKLDRNSAVLIENSANVVHNVTYSVAKPVTDVRQYAARVHYLPSQSGRKFLNLIIGDGGGTNFSQMHIKADVPVSTVDSTGTNGAGFTTPTYAAVAVSSRGWNLLGMSIPKQTAVSANISLTVQMSNASGTGGAYLGNGSSAVVIWGGQIEDVTGQSNIAPSEFIETNALYPNELINSENPLAATWNSVPGNSTTAAIAAPDGSLTAARITLGSNWVSGALPYRILGQRSTTTQRGTRHKVSIYIRKNSGTGTQIGADVCDSSAGTGVQTITTTWIEYTWNMTSPVSPGTYFLDLNLGAGWTAGDTIDIWRPTVLADPDNVLTAKHSLNGPSLGYFGAMVDGVKYFPYRNGNVLSSVPAGSGGTFTESQGTVISRSTLYGAMIEPASTQLLAANVMRDFGHASWVKTNVTVAVGTGVGVDGADLAGYNAKLTATANNGTAVLTTGLAANGYVYSLFIRRVTGTGNITITIDNFAASNVVVNPTSTTALIRVEAASGFIAPIIGVKFATSGDSIICDWNQVEQRNTVATSPMLGGATRAITALSYPTVRLPTNNFTFVYEWVQLQVPALAHVLCSYVDANNWSSIMFSTGALVNFRRNVGGVTTSIQFTMTTAERLVGQRHRMVVRFSSTLGTDAWYNGRRGSSNTANFTLPLGSKWELGAQNADIQTLSAASRFTVFNEYLTDDQCLDLSS